MAFDFSAKDIFDMAEQMEKNGANFYESAAAEAAGDADKELLLDLAAMEKGHEKVFAAMGAGLAESDSGAPVFDPEEESAKYLKALVDMRVFYKKEIDMSSMEAILKDAIVAEKDSIVFYLGMKDLVPDNAGKDKIDAIIKEEMDHVTILTNKLSRL